MAYRNTFWSTQIKIHADPLIKTHVSVGCSRAAAGRPSVYYTGPKQAFQHCLSADQIICDRYVAASLECVCMLLGWTLLGKLYVFSVNKNCSWVQMREKCNWIIWFWHCHVPLSESVVVINKELTTGICSTRIEILMGRTSPSLKL